MSDTEDLAGLRAAASMARNLATGVGPGQLDLPTPCVGWDVRQLLDHLTSGNWLFVGAVRGAEVTPEAPGSDPADDFAASCDAVVAAFSAPGALERTVSVPFGDVPARVAVHLRSTELLVHGWDLARALGERADVPAGLAERELAFCTSILERAGDGPMPFDPPQPVDDSAPAIDRLAGLLGRTP